MDRLVAHWVQGTGLAGVLLLLLTPVLAAGWSPAVTLAWLCLPIYMLHQYEEHDGDRFARFVNEHFGNGAEVLTRDVVFLVNVPVAWGVTALGFAFAAGGAEETALVGLYLVLLNGLLHVAQAMVLRVPNPGVWTALVLFLPFGAYGVARIEADAGTHLSAALLVVALHAAIVLNIAGKRPARV